MPSPQPTLLDRLCGAGVPVIAIGKIADLFAGRGITRRVPTPSDDAGVSAVLGAMQEQTTGFIFANLVDFDTEYGHRNQVQGYADNLERFDQRLPEVLGSLRPDDLLVITADHGNDPTTPSTDHSREYVPVLAACGHRPAGVDLGTRATFADLGQTVAEVFGAGPLRARHQFPDGRMSLIRTQLEQREREILAPQAAKVCRLARSPTP